MEFEKLGAFYLGKVFDPDRESVTDELVLYDSKDLTTHAVCVGMTGSGKTGLCVSLLEEAAIDGIPSIAIDVKGDLGNLALSFPNLAPADFEPWVDPAAAAQMGEDVAEYAARIAKRWKDGLADWGQDGTRIERYRRSAPVDLYTPGSSAGRQISVLESFDAPPPVLLEDADLFNERVRSAVSGLLALLGVDADPIQSREHILLSNILSTAWRDGRSLAIPDLIREISAPPFERVGVFDVDTFFPSKDRMALAMRVNNLVASPSFSSWLEGTPLDISRLLWGDDGKPRISVLSIAHLSDAERMFFVTLLLGEVVSWMRTQPGTQSLRAIVYMDEILGYFPPIANPPSKAPMITLLKQARAFGLGIVLATQNPVDLDYKGLGNTGTWLIGRLQTERDVERMIDGLAGASATAGARFDRRAMATRLAGLGKRVFLLNNVHEDDPVLFHTRWALSYLSGPLTRAQIRTLASAQSDGANDSPRAGDANEPKPGGASPLAPAPRAGPARSSAAVAVPLSRPVLPEGVEERFLPAVDTPGAGERLLYRPTVLGEARLHYVRASLRLDEWHSESRWTSIDSDDPSTDRRSVTWDESLAVTEDALDTIRDAEVDDAGFEPLPKVSRRSWRSTKSNPWSKELASYLYRERSLCVWTCKKPKAASKPGESRRDFDVRLRQLAHEARDLAVEKLRKKYAPKLASLAERIRKAEERVERERAQYSDRKLQTGISIGATILGALFGRKLSSRSNLGRATTAARSAGRTAKERTDIQRAEDEVEVLRERLAELEETSREEIAALQEDVDVDTLPVDELDIRPRKSDIEIRRLVVIWTPWLVEESGVARAAFDAPVEADAAT